MDSFNEDPFKEAHLDMDCLTVNDITTDAFSFEQREETREPDITIEKIQNIEREMDIFEKVSLVFLLYSDINLALQRLQAVEAHIKTATQSSSLDEISLISDWARTSASENGKCSEISETILGDCERAFIEALCIVQDFESLVRLGHGNRSSGLRTREMSYKSPEKSCVNFTRHVLYRLCEDMQPSVAEELVRRVEKERPDLVRRFPPDARLLEIVFLHWASRGFIRIDDDMDIDLRNLSRHLLIMGEMSMAKILDTNFPYVPKPLEIEEGRGTPSFGNDKNKDFVYQSPIKDLENNKRLITPSLSITTDHQALSLEMKKAPHECIVPEKMGAVSKKLESEEGKAVPVKRGAISKRSVYTVNESNMGFCIIVNQKNFYNERNPALVEYLPERPLEDRLGTDVDRDRLIEAFTSLGFKIYVKTNLRHDELLALARNVAAYSDLEKQSCFVFCILSHGQKDVVYGTNSIPVEIMALVETFCGQNCPGLIGKPKIFVIQACQGSKLQRTDLATDGPTKSLAGVKDYVKFLSTVPGYVSLRHKVTGSWFIENLCEEILCREPNSSLIDVFTQVNAALDKKSSVLGNSVVSMMSELRSTLRGPLYLPQDRECMRKAAIHAIHRALFNKLLEEFFERLEASSKSGSEANRT